MNKASGGDGIPVELFQILKDEAVKRKVKKRKGKIFPFECRVPKNRKER